MWIVVYKESFDVNWGDGSAQVAEITDDQQKVIKLLEEHKTARVFEAKELKAKVKPVLVFE